MVLLSGGLDSTTCLAIAHADKTVPYALTILYGQRHRAEVNASRAVAHALGAKEHKFVSVDLHAIGGSALTDDIPVPKSGPSATIPPTYVPARNTIFLSIALGYAEVIGAGAIYAGMNALDYSGYPDCRPEFVAAFQTLTNVATKAAVEGRPIEIRAPLIDLTKSEIIKRGLELGVDYSITHTCYDPAEDGRACRECDACRIREKAFAALGLSDPILG